MASTPDYRSAATSLSDPAGFSGLPVSPDASSSLAAVFQRQLDEFQAIHCRLQQLDATVWAALDPVRPPPPATGNFLVVPVLREFHRHLASLAHACGALAGSTQNRLARTRHGIQRLRDLTLTQRA